MCQHRQILLNEARNHWTLNANESIYIIVCGDTHTQVHWCSNKNSEAYTVFAYSICLYADKGNPDEREKLFQLQQLVTSITHEQRCLPDMQYHFHFEY